MEPITVVAGLLVVQGALGAFDTFFNHEWREKLPRHRWASTELALHSLRSAHFAFVFAGIAWLEWHGTWAWVMLAAMLSEYVVTIVDSVVEDRTRRLGAIERANHMLLALNTGLYIAFFMAQMATRWNDLPTALAPAALPLWLQAILTACAVAVVVWTVRDGRAAQRLGKVVSG